MVGHACGALLPLLPNNNIFQPNIERQKLQQIHTLNGTNQRNDKKLVENVEKRADDRGKDANC